MREGPRLQKGIPVQLLNAQGRILDTKKTADEGQFEFKDLEPGSYRVLATKTPSNTRGEV